MKQIEVQIMGQSYLLGSPEGGEAQLREAVERVDTAMCKIRDAGKVKARDRIAVLASLNLAFDLVQREAAAAGSEEPRSPADAPAGEPAATQPSADTEPTSSVDAAPTLVAAHDDARLSQILHRLDQALAGDGLLL